jgi:hypothetical protein
MDLPACLNGAADNAAVHFMWLQNTSISLMLQAWIKDCIALMH